MGYMAFRLLCSKTERYGRTINAIPIEPKGELPDGDRKKSRKTNDGTLVIVFRDVYKKCIFDKYKGWEKPSPCCSNKKKYKPLGTIRR